MNFLNQRHQLAPNQTVYLIGLSIHSLALAKHLIFNRGFTVKLLSNTDIQDLLGNQEYAHLVEYNQFDNLHCTLADLQSTLDHFSNGLLPDKCLRRVDNFEVYETDSTQIAKLKDLIGTQVEVTADHTVIHNQTFLILPFLLIHELYNSINSSPNFEHIIVRNGSNNPEVYLNHIPHFQNFKIINFMNFASDNMLRKQTLLLRSNQLINSSFISKTRLDQFTKLLPLPDSENFISISGPIQFNDSYKYPRDSDTLNLISRAELKFPLLGKVDFNSIVDIKVFFRDCFADRKGRIWIEKIGLTNVINCCGFGFKEIDSIGGVLENLSMLLDEPRSKF